MLARNVSFRLKSNTHSDYMRTFENEILPLPRKQAGVRDAITLSDPNSQGAVAISLWGQQSSCRCLQHESLPRSVANTCKNDRWNAEGADA